MSSQGKHVVKCSGIGKPVPSLQAVRRPKVKKAVRKELAEIEHLRQISNILGKLASQIEKLIKQHGRMVKDIDETRQKIFLSNLAKGLKNKNLKKQFDKKKFKLLEKCGVVKKVNLTDDDVARIKTRIDLV